MIPLGVIASVPRQGGGGGGDPHWANVVSLLHFDGADGSTVFADQTGKVWTRNGTTTRISTAQSRFGGSSLLVGTTVGAGTVNGLVTGSSTDFDFGTGDFTIEWWQYLTDLSSNQCLLSRGGFGTAGSMLIQKDPGQIVGYIASTQVLVTSFFSLGVWDHYAVCRQSGTVRTYYKGAQVDSRPDAGSVGRSDPLGLGAYANGSYGTCGYLDEVRITKGVCRYLNGSTFTPPAGPFPDY